MNNNKYMVEDVLFLGASAAEIHNYAICSLSAGNKRFSAMHILCAALSTELQRSNAYKSRIQEQSMMQCPPNDMLCQCTVTLHAVKLILGL